MKRSYLMSLKTIQKRCVINHLSRISNIRIYSLENGFVGELIKKISDYSLQNGKLRVDEDTHKGHLRVHSNLWYEFDYN
jgi:hypothetical protein